MTSWEKEIDLPNKDPKIEYAYILDSKSTPVVCDKDTLMFKIEENENISLVATPESDSFILAGTSLETLKPILNKKKEEARQSLKVNSVITLFIAGILLLVSYKSGESFWADPLGMFFLFGVGIIPILSNAFNLFELKKVNTSNYIDFALEIKFYYWIAQKKIFTLNIVTGVLVFIFLFQLFLGLSDSIELAGLVKPKTFSGEYWRLLTCMFLHAGFMHIGFNGAAIYAIGRILVRLTSFYYLAIVFLFTGLLGSLFSLFLLPDLTSVGASGGIMGLIGFILVLSIKLKSIPKNIAKSMFVTILFVALFGVFAIDLIDNPAHGGGLLGGIILGMLLIKKGHETFPYRSSFTIKVLGIISAVILVGGVGLILYYGLGS